MIRNFKNLLSRSEIQMTFVQSQNTKIKKVPTDAFQIKNAGVRENATQTVGVKANPIARGLILATP